MKLLVIVFFFHFVGDFVFQTNKMARHKRHSLKWLSIHVGVYSVILITISLFIFEWQEALLFGLINGALHWVTDFFTSKLNHKLNQFPNKHYFFIGIGFDQFIHAACLLLTFEYYYEQSFFDTFPNFF